MLKLKLVKVNTADEVDDAANRTAPAQDDNYGTIVLKSLVAPWAGRGQIGVETYSYFAFVQYAK